MNSRLKSANWGRPSIDEKGRGCIAPSDGPFSVSMAHSDGKALPLIVDDDTSSGMDIIHFEPGGRVPLHTHDGAHYLMVIEGEGRLTFAEEIHELFPGKAYFVPGDVEHAIDAKTRLSLISIALLHRPADSTARLEVVGRDMYHIDDNNR